jgi:hypothetical protein
MLHQDVNGAIQASCPYMIQGLDQKHRWSLWTLLRSIDRLGLWGLDSLDPASEDSLSSLFDIHENPFSCCPSVL